MRIIGWVGGLWGRIVAQPLGDLIANVPKVTTRDTVTIKHW